MTEPSHIPQRIVDIALAAMEQQEEHYSTLPLEDIVRITIAAVRTEVLVDRDKVTEQRDAFLIQRDNLRNMVLAECDSIVAEVYGQHDEDDDGMREAVERIRGAVDAWQKYTAGAALPVIAGPCKPPLHSTATVSPCECEDQR